VNEVPYFWVNDSAGYRAYRSAFTGFSFSAGPFLEPAWSTEGSR
jgi:hypothetical protein